MRSREERVGLESTTEHRVGKWAQSKQILTFKFTPAGIRGLPDRIFLRQGKACFIEFKAKGERPSALQEFYLEVLNKEKFRAVYCDNFSDATAFLTAALLTPPVPDAGHTPDADASLSGPLPSAGSWEDIDNAGGGKHPS